MARPRLAPPLGRRIRLLRTQRGLTQDGLALESGLHRNYVGALERGERNPTLLTLERIADALRISTPELLEAAGRAVRSSPRRPAK